MTLLLGCGRTQAAPGMITLDADPFLQPDVVCMLGVDPLPFPDDSIDHVIATHVLEHIGKAGETAGWFFFWEELYRVMTPGATLQCESPLWTSVWAWADPSHVRALSPHAFAFLSQDTYRRQGSSISPYRIRCDFVPGAPYERLRDVNPDVALMEEFSHFRGTLVAQKPLRVWWES